MGIKSHFLWLNCLFYLIFELKKIILGNRFPHHLIFFKKSFFDWIVYFIWIFKVIWIKERKKKQKKSWNMWFRRSINLSIPLKKCLWPAHRTAAKSMVYINDIFKNAHFPAHRAAALVHSFTLTITYSWINNCQHWVWCVRFAQLFPVPRNVARGNNSAIKRRFAPFNLL